ncbi:MAG: hypothetical protein DRH26_12390 [Deltaproteobacteria bacterium]|nr:MAG: hypothetical protein DRH26_12390 [Deltaproteobacteria bacterium]
MKFVLYFSSLSIIFFSGLYLYQENITPEWRTHQLAYIERIGQIDQNASVGKTSAPRSFSIGLKQIWLPEMNRVDRCISCHVVIEDPGFKKNTNPLKAHPLDYLGKHNPEKLGCTICHDGQGRAVNFKDAAADYPDVFWNKPLLRKPFIEANCYRCHVDLLDQTPVYNKGKQKFESSGCLGCHKRDGKGGFTGSELRGIGNASHHVKHPDESLDPKILSQLNYNQNLAYIYAAVRFPGAQPEDTMMFDFQLSHEDTRALTVYLKSLSMHQTGIQYLPQKPVYSLPITEKGEKNFQLYCTACHGKNGKGGVRNPNYKNDYIPRLNTLAEQMFLHKKMKQDAVILILDEVGDLLEAGPQPDISGFFKVVAKYMPVKNIIENGRIVERKDKKGPSPLNMPAWRKSLSQKDISSVIAYLIDTY